VKVAAVADSPPGGIALDRSAAERLPGWVTERLPFYGWFIVAVGALASFSSGPGQSYSFAVFIDALIADTGLSRTTISALYAVGTSVSAGLVYLVSRLDDRYGVRRVLPLVALAMGLACFGMAASTGFFSFFLAFAALRSLGQGSMSIHGTLLVAQWFVRKRGRAMACVGLGIAFSAAIVPPASRALMNEFGWRGAYVALGIAVWLLVIPAALLIVRERPEDVGLYPDGADYPPVGEPPRSAAVGVGRSRNVLSTWRFWHLALPMCIPSFVVTALIFHQVSIFAERGLSANLAAGVFVVYAIASASCSLLAGFLIERVGPKALLIANLCLLSVATAGALMLVSPAAAGLYAAALGMNGGIQSVIGMVAWAQYYGRHGLGRVQGAASMVGIAASAIGPLPLAALRTVGDGYALGLALLALLPLAGVALVATYHPPTGNHVA
jgi:MFS family permease